MHVKCVTYFSSDLYLFDTCTNPCLTPEYLLYVIAMSYFLYRLHQHDDSW